MKKAAFFVFILFFGLKAMAQGVTIDPSLTETSISAKTLSGSISGSLVMPKAATGKIPVVIIIGDRGATDRDGNNAKTGVAGNTYKLMANDLGLKGIATVRYDKHLVGKSVTSTKESQLHFEDYSDDVVTLIDMLNNDDRFSKIILFGHGEGALVAMIAAYEQPIKGLISAEANADKAEKILADEMKAKPKFLADEFKAIMDSLRKGKLTENVDPSLYYIARPAVQPFLMSWCRYDPIRAIKSVKVPILIIQGTTDMNIPVSNGDRLKKAKSDAVLLSIKNMSHILKEAPADTDKNIETYSNPTLPLKPEMVTGIVDFIGKLK